MFSRIELFTEKKMLGNSIQMSFAENKTTELWKNFMPKVKQLNLPANANLYSVELYSDITFFSNFNPAKSFVKWAAVEADKLSYPSSDLQTLIIPTGLYAVFIHKGPAVEGYKTYEFIFKNWLPQSDYVLDDRPHFALMGEKYKNNDPDSEEEIWIPVKERI
ncbi:GyrI-like domain-containing protein [Cytophaga aurantiaca]|uniref:GyrI-like domain-containing protein n=1 Tax=Cytophaga aurantiaca TaxID=29530 RepID=UPI0003722C2A|nr:GyrI-like domain-containing protein [Cytophaga aurantiaca]